MTRISCSKPDSMLDRGSLLMTSESEMVRPCCGSVSAWRRTSGVMWLSVPRVSSGPQRPQLLKRSR